MLARLQRMRAGIAANGVNQLTLVFVRLAEVPLLAGAWGASGYGEWLLISALPAALAIGDGGFSKSAQREMTSAMAAGRREDAIAAFHSAICLVLCVSIACSLIVAGSLAVGLDLRAILNLTTASKSSASIAAGALSMKVLVYFQCSLLHAGFTCGARYAKSVVLLTIVSALSFAGTAVAVLLGFGIAGAAIGTLFGTLLGLLVMLGAYWSQTDRLPLGMARASWGGVKSLWKPSVANLAFPLGDALNSQGLRVVIGLTLGPAALAAFATMRTLCRVALQPVLAISRTAEPEVSMAFGVGDGKGVKKIFIQSSQVGLWASLVIAAAILVLGDVAFRIWVGGHIALDKFAVLVLLAASMVNAMWSLAMAVPASINRHVSIAWWYVCSNGLVATIAACALLRWMPGVTAGALAVLCGELLVALVVMRVAFSVSRVTTLEWFQGVRTPPVDVLAKAFAALAGGALKPRAGR